MLNRRQSPKADFQAIIEGRATQAPKLWTLGELTDELNVDFEKWLMSDTFRKPSIIRDFSIRTMVRLKLLDLSKSMEMSKHHVKRQSTLNEINASVHMSFHDCNHLIVTRNG